MIIILILIFSYLKITLPKNPEKNIAPIVKKIPVQQQAIKKDSKQKESIPAGNTKKDMDIPVNTKPRLRHNSKPDLSKNNEQKQNKIQSFEKNSELNPSQNNTNIENPENNNISSNKVVVFDTVQTKKKVYVYDTVKVVVSKPVVIPEKHKRKRKHKHKRRH